VSHNDKPHSPYGFLFISLLISNKDKITWLSVNFSPNGDVRSGNLITSTAKASSDNGFAALFRTSLARSQIFFKDGNEAVKYLKDGQSFDLLFTDVVLPGGMNGDDVAKEAKRLQPGIQVLYTTGYAETAIVHNGRLDPGVILVNKPYRRRDLLEKVRTLLDSAKA